MKLSKNKIHKLKHQKNSSRKKAVFRRKANTSHENSKKKNKKVKNLRKKTLKRFKGGDEAALPNDTSLGENKTDSLESTGIKLVNKSLTPDEPSEESASSMPQSDNTINTNSDEASNATVNNLINRIKLAHPEIVDPIPVPLPEDTTYDNIPEATDDESVPEDTTDESIPEDTTDESGSKPTPFTNEQLETIYDSYRLKYVLDDSGNEIEKLVPFTKKSLIRLLTSTNEDGIKIRQLFGFPANMNKSQLTTGSEINRIFDNILTTIGIDARNANTSAPLSDENNISFVEFKKFVECGTYRDKNTSDNFNCINIKPPVSTDNESTNNDPTNNESRDNESTNNESTNNESTDNVSTNIVSTDSNIATASPVLESPQNIELNINEQPYNTTIKRVDISIFVPNDSRVIVRDYAKNTVNETLADFMNYQPGQEIEAAKDQYPDKPPSADQDPDKPPSADQDPDKQPSADQLLH